LFVSESFLVFYRNYGLKDCHPHSSSLEEATVRFYQYNSKGVHSFPLFPFFSSINQSNAKFNLPSFLDSLRKQNVSRLRLIEMNLPIIDTFITDNYRASYVWNLRVLFEYRSQVSVSLSMNQEIKQICNIDLSSRTFFVSQFAPSSSSSQRHSSSENNLNSENISLSSLQGIMNILCLFILFFSFIYFVILLYETIQNLRLFCFISDVMSFHVLRKQQPSTALPYSSAASTSSRLLLYLSLWGKKLQLFVSFLLRSLLSIPEQYYLNDFPVLSTLFVSSSSSLQFCRAAPSDLYDYPTGISRKERKLCNVTSLINGSGSDALSANLSGFNTPVIPSIPVTATLGKEKGQESEDRNEALNENTPERKFLNDWKSLSFKVKVHYIVSPSFSSMFIFFVFVVPYLLDSTSRWMAIVIISYDNLNFLYYCCVS
jgi:hypothetical protein